MSDTRDQLTRIVYTETEVGQLLGLHRTTVRAQAMQPNTVLGQCVIMLTPSKRVYRREAIHRLVGLGVQSDHEKVA